MKTASVAMQGHLALRQQTMTACLKLKKRSGGAALGFTEFNRDISFDLGDGDGAVTYKANRGFRRSALSHESDLSIPNLDLEGLLGSGGLTRADVRAGVYNGATVLVFLVNWADTSMGAVKLLKGRLGRITPQGNSFTAELQGLADLLARGEILEVWSPGCRATLADDRCQADLTGMGYAGQVSAVVSHSQFVTAAFAAAPLAGDPTYFDGGRLTWLTGNNAGTVIEVRKYTDGTKTWQLPVPLPYAIQVGDTWSCQPGCSKTAAVCKARFDNLVNFRGEPHVPEGDRVRYNPNAAPGGGYKPGS
jgi:uncharacterized phage protein (TIGR02218 family)